MGLAIRSKRHGGILLTLTAVFALVAQPMYGFVAAQVASAVGASGEVLVNEFSANNGTDWVELYNTGGVAKDVTGWSLYDSTGEMTELTGTIPAGGVRAFDVNTRLNQSTDEIRVLDEVDFEVDAVAYPSDVATPIAGTYAARTTDGFSTWVLREHQSKGVSNTPNAAPTTPSLAVTPATCENPVNTAVLTGDPTDFRWEFSGDIRLQGEYIPAGEFDVVTELQAYGISLPYGLNEGQLVWYDRAGSKTDVYVQDVSITLTDPSALECEVSATAVTNTNNGKMFDTLTEALNDPATNDGDTLRLNENLTVSTQINIDRPIVIEGNDHTITGDFIKNGNGNNSVLAVSADHVTISSLVLDVVTPANELHGLNTYKATNLTLNNITAKNGRTGVNINRSTVTIDGVTTSGNAWHGINVDKPGAALIIKGSNSHTEAKAIYVDDRAVGQVTDTDHQYGISKDPMLAAADIYTLDTTGPSVSWQVQPDAYYGIGAGFHVRPINPEANVTKSIYFDSVAPENLCSSLTSVHKNFDATQVKCQNAWDSLTEGTHKFIAVFTDTAGNTSAATDSKSFIVDRTMPEVKINLNRASYAASGDVISKLQNAEIEARDTNLGRVELWKNGVITGHVWTANNSKRLANIKFLGEGDYTVKAFDKADNQSNNFTFTVDNTAPVAPVMDATGIVSGGFTKNNSVTVNWSKPSSDTVKYEYAYWNSITGSSYNNENSAWKTEVTGQSRTGTFTEGEGVHYMKVRAIDVAGNISDWSNAFTLTYDKTQPSNFAVSLSDGRSAQGVTISGEQTFTFTQDETHPKSIYIEYMEKDSAGVWRKKLGREVLDQNTASLTVNTANWKDGQHQIKVTTKDYAGNATSMTTQFMVDNTAPTITVKTGSNGDRSTKAFSTISFKLFDAHKVDKYVLNDKTVDFTNNEYSDANFQNIKSKLIEGQNTLVLYDVAGNSTPYSFIYDVTAPVITERTPAQDSSVINANGEVVISARVTDEAAGVDNVRFDIRSLDGHETNPSANGTNKHLLTRSATKDGDVYRVVLPQGTLPSGTYGLRITAWDKAENKAYEWNDYTQHTFVVDNSITLSIDPVAGTSTTPTISGTARWSADDTIAAGQSVAVELRRDGTVIRTFEPVQVDTTGKWSVQVVPALSAGTYSVYAAIGSNVVGDNVVGPEPISVEVSQVPRADGNPTSTPANPSPDGPSISTIISSAPQQLSTNFSTIAATTPVLATATPSSDDDESEVRGLSTSSSAAEDTSDQEGEVKAAEDSKPTWSLVNALLAAVAVVMGLMALLGLFGKKEEGEESMNGRRIAAVVLGAGSVVALLFLENFSGSMSFVDLWTLAFAAIAAAQIAIIATLKRA